MYNATYGWPGSYAKYTFDFTLTSKTQLGICYNHDRSKKYYSLPYISLKRARTQNKKHSCLKGIPIKIHVAITTKKMVSRYTRGRHRCNCTAYCTPNTICSSWMKKNVSTTTANKLALHSCDTKHIMTCTHVNMTERTT